MNIKLNALPPNEKTQQYGASIIYERTTYENTVYTIYSNSMVS